MGGKIIMKKTHKRKKSSRYHGLGMGTCGSGARKKHRENRENTQPKN